MMTACLQSDDEILASLHAKENGITRTADWVRVACEDAEADLNLATRGMLQMLKFGATLVTPINVDRLEPATTPGGNHVLHLDCGHTISAPAILIASGVRWRKLQAKGAERFERAGVFFACTTVEATLYDNQDTRIARQFRPGGDAVHLPVDRQAHHLPGDVRDKQCPDRRRHHIAPVESHVQPGGRLEGREDGRELTPEAGQPG